MLRGCSAINSWVLIFLKVEVRITAQKPRWCSGTVKAVHRDTKFGKIRVSRQAIKS